MSKLKSDGKHGFDENGLVETASWVDGADSPRPPAWDDLTDIGAELAPAAGEVLLSDRGAAQLVLRSRYGLDIHYCDQLGGKWLIWDGQHWKVDDTKEIELLVKETIRQYFNEVAHQYPSFNSEHVSWALRQENDARIKATIRSLMSEPGVSVTASDLDHDPWRLNCLNGTLNLRNGQLLPHARDDLITKLVPVSYEPAAECPTWMKFLKDVLVDDAVIEYVQRVVGYSLTGTTREQCFFLLQGNGQNGKSVFARTVMDLMGDYGQQMNFFALTANSSVSEQRAALYRLPGARFVVASESERGARLAETMLKQLTGEDRVVARALYKEEFEFMPQAKLILVTNYLPKISSSDYAMWRRVRLIPFPVTISDEERDNELQRKLREELPGILAWAVRGCLAWQQSGLAEPVALKQAKEAYRRQVDTVARFRDECCELDPTAMVSSAELYEAYKQWCADENEQAVGQKAFSQRLQAEPNLKKARTTRGKKKGRAAWAGIKLK